MKTRRFDEKPIKILLVEDEAHRLAVSALWRLGFIGPPDGAPEPLSHDEGLDMADDLLGGSAESHGVGVEVAVSLDEAYRALERNHDQYDFLIADVRLGSRDVTVPAPITDQLQRVSGLGTGHLAGPSSAEVCDSGGLYIWALFGQKLQRSGCKMYLYSGSEDVQRSYHPFLLPGAQPRVFVRGADAKDPGAWGFLEEITADCVEKVRRVVRSSPNRVPELLAVRRLARALPMYLANGDWPSFQVGIRKIALQSLAGCDVADLMVPWIFRALRKESANESVQVIIDVLQGIPLIQEDLDELYRQFCQLANIAHPDEMQDFLKMAEQGIRTEWVHVQCKRYLRAVTTASRKLEDLREDLGWNESLELEDLLKSTLQRLFVINGHLDSRDDTSEPVLMPEMEAARRDLDAFKSALDSIYRPHTVVRDFLQNLPLGVHMEEASPSSLLDSDDKLDGGELGKITTVPDLLRQILKNWASNVKEKGLSRTAKLEIGDTDNGARELIITLACKPKQVDREVLQGYEFDEQSSRGVLWQKSSGTCRIADILGGYIVVRSGSLERDSRDPGPVEISRLTEGTEMEVHLPFL